MYRADQWPSGLVLDHRAGLVVVHGQRPEHVGRYVLRQVYPIGVVASQPIAVSVLIETDVLGTLAGHRRDNHGFGRADRLEGVLAAKIDGHIIRLVEGRIREKDPFPTTFPRVRIDNLPGHPGGIRQSLRHRPADGCRLRENGLHTLVRLEGLPVRDAERLQHAEHRHVLRAGRVLVDVAGQGLEVGEALVGQQVGVLACQRYKLGRRRVGGLIEPVLPILLDLLDNLRNVLFRLRNSSEVKDDNVGIRANNVMVSSRHWPVVIGR